MKVHVVSLFLTFLVIPISASAESITCNQLGYFSNGVVLVTPDQNNPDVIETPIGETSVNYGGATLWCVGGLKKAGYIAPMVSGPEEFTLLSYSNCMGVYSEGSCCKTNIAFMPKTPGIKRGVVFQEENILNTNGTVLEKQMRCVDIQGIGSGEQISFDLKLYDENGNVIDRNFQEMEPSRYSCGKVKNDTLNTRKFVIKCLQDDSNNPGIKTQISGCKVKVGLAGEIQNGGHDITTHIESSDRYGTFDVPMNTFVNIPIEGLSIIYTASDASVETSFEFQVKDPSDKLLSEKPLTTFRVKHPTDFLPLNIEGLRVDITSHPNEGFYVTESMHTKLSKAISGYRNEIYERYGTPILVDLETEAASLSWGGLFDIERNWTYPHCGHRTGNQLDLSMSVFNIYNNKLRAKLKQILESHIRDSELNFPVAAESPTGNKHWHVQENN